MQSCEIAPMTEQDWGAVREIYIQGIATGNATFEKSVPEWKEWDERHLPSCRLVARSEEKVVGWAALTLVSSRCVYGAWPR
jgi:L-amino acid N-acyltransferase YncA